MIVFALGSTEGTPAFSRAKAYPDTIVHEKTRKKETITPVAGELVLIVLFISSSVNSA
jgi:hypothetical protein